MHCVLLQCAAGLFAHAGKLHTCICSTVCRLKGRSVPSLWQIFRTAMQVLSFALLRFPSMVINNHDLGKWTGLFPKC